jgi:sugar O-acyltransferase (sialic acid O-acetyltransferase NeuD family)
MFVHESERELILETMVRRIKVAIVPVEWDVVDLVESLPHLEVMGFFDANADQFTGEFPRLGADKDWPEVRRRHPDLKIAIMIDPPTLRARLFDLYTEDAVISVISPHAHISCRSVQGPGFIAQRDVIVMGQTRIGRGCTLNVGATLHHQTVLGDFVSIAPGARLLGAVEIGDFGYVGAGAVIRQNVRVGAHAKVGAGAVVVRDVPEGAVVVGVPADRRLR